MNTPRPYADLGIDQLEELVTDISGSHPINDQILAELGHRNTQRALRLRGRREKMRGNSNESAEAQIAKQQPTPANLSPSRAASSPRRPVSLPLRSTDPNDPQNILRAWTVLEVLSPASFKTPADLAAGDGRRVARFENGLPWADGSAKSPHNTRLFFQIVPDRLTAAICQTFNVDPQRFGAPTASVQTLADDATAWFAEFPARVGSRTVGVPLLVHRRCSSPMFDIANRIAYENLMVQAKTERASAIRDLIGPSRWIDVTGSGEDKWCLREGQEALAMIEQIVSAGIKPDLYIVTPFVIVANGLRRLFRDSSLLTHAIPELDRWTRTHIGTIHTVQGREAEAVIFVLGAPNEDQTGARAWAGKDPNLLNVAVTRAKEAVYVIGNKALWQSAGVFADLNSVMSRY